MQVNNIAGGMPPPSPIDPTQVADCPEPLISRFANAVQSDDPVALKTLLRSSADAARIAAELEVAEYSPLHDAAARGMTDCLKVMFDYLPFRVWNFRTAETQKTPLMLAVENGHAAFIDELSKQAKCRAFQMDLTYQAGKTAKADFGCEQASEPASLAVRNSIINARDHDGNTPILLAIQNKHFECARLLRKEGADLSVTNHYGDGVGSFATDPDSVPEYAYGQAGHDYRAPDGTIMNVEFFNTRPARSAGCSLL
ncbi:ankyrin repeat domain-containing protein [Bordetella sp. 02P26C-1]|uniref:ankyrin repeat domain-containing protein n=1 Tax=Bordetella sp. 02P26C-1 TaxID=2683195 RepID=UPI001353A3FF|nr:ankyrin repeat domain-containing protein [Bordetella sp. 02P26C-1]MVW78920.1 hypothetical protein [Bordetella sp. 02P26C-1]